MDTIKPISHFERTHTRADIPPVEYNVRDVSITETVICPITHRPIQQIKRIKPDMKCSTVFKVSDFSLESHLLAGSIGTLTSSQLSHDKLTSMQIAEKQLENIIK